MPKPAAASKGTRRSARLSAAAPALLAKKAPSKKAAAAPPAKKAKTAPATKKSAVKTATAPTPHSTARVQGAVDPEFQQSGSAVVAEDDNGTPYDVFLVLIEPAINSDKFYVLQIIEDDDQFTSFSRWGRTGLKGQTQSQGPFDSIEEAVKAFEKKFKEKTGNTWDDYVAGSFAAVAGKYDALSSPLAATVILARQAGVTWEYEVTDNVAGKTNGWYAYDDENADEVETVYQAFIGNGHSAALSKRQISTQSSGLCVFSIYIYTCCFGFPRPVC